MAIINRKRWLATMLGNKKMVTIILKYLKTTDIKKKFNVKTK